MSFGNGKKEFRKYYPLVDKWAYIWLITIVLVFVLDVVIFIFADFQNTISVVISIVAMLGVLSVCVVGFVITVVKRKRILDQVILFKDKIVYLDMTERYKMNSLRDFIKEVEKLNFPKLVKEVLTTPEKSYSEAKIKGVVFAFLMRSGEIVINNPGRKPRKAAGSQKWENIELTWEGDINQTLSLLCHELAHVFIYNSGEVMTEVEQHKLFSERGIDCAWKGTK